MIADATQWVRSTKWRLTYNGGQNPATVMENVASTSLTYQIIRCSVVCTSLTAWIPRMALPSPLQTMLG